MYNGVGAPLASACLSTCDEKKKVGRTWRRKVDVERQSSEERCESPWASAGGLTAAALREVFAWLGGAELARAGAVCRAWRAAAAEPALWRRLLLPLAPAATRAQLAPLYESRAWRAEWVRAHAGWAQRARLAAGRAPLAHAALAPCARRLALATEDAAVLIWERSDSEEEPWREVCSRSVRARGWASVERVQWAPGGGGGASRLLLAGPLAVANRWELIVLQEQEELEAEAGEAPRRTWSVAARAGCSAGAAGCWAGAGAFLALELRRLAPFQYVTVVWLNAATQETQSEYAGVTSPLLRVYNEEAAAITHVAVAEVPLEMEQESLSGDQEEALDECSRSAGDTGMATVQTLVAGFGGESGVLRTWGMRALRPPPLLAAGDLRARARARRAAREPEPEPAPEPDEHAVRASCTPSDHHCRLPAALEGLLVQPDGRCVWACMSGARVWCAALPALRVLRELRPPALPAPLYLHYVQPALDQHYFVTPTGARAGLVCAWALPSGAALPPLAHAAPALAAALPAPGELLVLAADALVVWRTRASPQPTSEDT